MKEQPKKLSRRDALKLLGAAAGASVLANLPSKWNTPEIASGVLPAHAQTSCADITGEYASWENDDYDTSGDTEYDPVIVTREGDTYTVRWYYEGELWYTGTGKFDCETFYVIWEEEGGSDTGESELILQPDGSLKGAYGDVGGPYEYNEIWIPRTTV